MIEQVRRLVRDELARRAFFAFGVVKVVDWARQRARVTLAAGYDTNWLRIGSPAAGDGGGALAPVDGGDEVLCCFPNGDPQGQGVVLCRLYGSAAVPRLGEQAAGVAIGAHKVLLDANGAVACQVASLDVDASGAVEIDGLQVKLGGGASAAVKFEQLAASLTAWVPLLQAAFLTAAIPGTPPVPHPLAVVIPPIDVSAAAATKVRVT